MFCDSRELRPTNASVRGRPQLGRRMIFYSIYGWAVPAIIVLIGVILDNVQPANSIRPRFGEIRCWFSGNEHKRNYFYKSYKIFEITICLQEIALLCLISMVR